MHTSFMKMHRVFMTAPQPGRAADRIYLVMAAVKVMAA